MYYIYIGKISLRQAIEVKLVNKNCNSVEKTLEKDENIQSKYYIPQQIITTSNVDDSAEIPFFLW